MADRKWREVSAEQGAEVHRVLIDRGGTEIVSGLGPHEAWRVRFPAAAVTMYTNGTIYMTPFPAARLGTPEPWAWIDEIISPPFAATEKSLLIGFDESGKSEIAGDAVLTGVLLPVQLAGEAEAIAGTAETKSSHPPEYFARLADALDALKPRGLKAVVERIPPNELDRYNVNGLFDVTYARIAMTLFDGIRLGDARVAADDYRIGGPFKIILDRAAASGAEVFPEHHADNRFWRRGSLP